MKLSEFKQLIKQSILEEKEKETKNTGAMTPEEEEMVAGYEREQDAKHALDKEQPMEEGLSIPDDIKWEWDGQVLDQTDYHSAEIGLEGYSPSTGRSFTASVPAFENGGDWEWNDGDVDFIEEAPLEEIIRRTDKIVESWNSKKKTLKEAAPSSANASKIAKLQKERDQIMRDMEQEAEPEGGPVADEYGAMLDKIDAQIRKLKGLKETASIKEEMTGGYLEIMEMNPKFDQGIEMLLEVWEEWKSGEMTEPQMIDEAKQDLLQYLSSMLD